MTRPALLQTSTRLAQAICSAAIDTSISVGRSCLNTDEAVSVWCCMSKCMSRKRLASARTDAGARSPPLSEPPGQLRLACGGAVHRFSDVPPAKV
jgi:hypothetical protein